MKLSLEQANSCIKLLSELDVLALETFPIKREEPSPENEEQAILALRLKGRRRWQECSATFIDAYIGLHPELTPQEIQNLKNWKNRQRQQYVVTSYTDDTAILVHAKSMLTFEITHLTDTFSAVLNASELPTVIETTLLPYENTIVWDGLIMLLTRGPVKKEIADFFKGFTDIIQKNNSVIRSL